MLRYEIVSTSDANETFMKFIYFHKDRYEQKVSPNTQCDLSVLPLFYQLQSDSYIFFHCATLCLAGWTSHWAKEVKTPTKETGTNPERKGPATKRTQQSYPGSKQTGESVPRAAETQQDPEGMWHPVWKDRLSCRLHRFWPLLLVEKVRVLESMKFNIGSVTCSL